MISVAIIPIDNRPICYDLIGDILSINDDIKLYMPDLSLSGGLYDSSDIEGVFNFIKNLADVDYFIISLDTLAYGGLVTSRRTSDSYEIIKNRIEKLKALIPKKARILAFSSIMRISNNNINEEEKEYWSVYGKKIFEWSYKTSKKIRKFGRLKYDYSEFNNDIPSEILKDYIDTRKRNFKINRLYLKMAQDGFFDTLIFSKDDCAQYGLNVDEANALEYLIKKDNINNVFIKTGADEIPLTLIARALSEKNKIKIKPIFVEKDSINLISKYEDISIKNCVEGQLSLANVEISENPDITFLINNFKNEQGDLVLGDVINNTDEQIHFPETPYFIADVNNANGADNKFIEQLFSKKTDNLYGYCGYNTSANSIGCAILSATVKHIALKNNSYNDTAFKKLQFIRLLDDWSYQAKNRKHVRKSSPDFQKGLLEIEPKLNNDANIISDFLNYYPEKIKYALPWDRSFEIRIKVC